MPRLRIVTVNDVYSLENLPRLKSLVQHHRTAAPADLLLVTMAGDFLAPSLLSSLDAGRGMVDCLNDVGVTHLVLGNHEDDQPLDELRARLAELRGVPILTNIRGFEDGYPTHAIVNVGGVQVGLVGVCDGDPTLFRGPPFGGARVSPANEAAVAEARALQERGVDVVVALTHQRMPDDRALAATGVFPLILGGHEHEAHLERIGDCWVAKAPMDAVQAVVVDLEVGAAHPVGAMDSVHVVLEDVAAYPEDPSLRARVDGHMARVKELETATLLLLGPGESLSSIGTRRRQTSLGTLLCSRLRDAFEADGCLFNGGGIRAAREYQGRFTYGDLRTEVPFDNEVVVARLPGRLVREAVAASRALLPAESGGFLQVDDRMEVDDRGEVVAIDGRPLEEERTYRIALVRNFFEGMDRIGPLMRFAQEHPEAIPMPTSGREVKLALVSAFSTLLWKQLGGFAHLDVDRDGKVTADELLRALAKATHAPASPIAARIVLDALDKDRDDAISAQESPDQGG